jgi:toluene monooxygenase system protein E
VERFAYRVRQLQIAFPGFAEDSKARWQHDPMWQPLREIIEKLLTTWELGRVLRRFKFGSQANGG